MSHLTHVAFFVCLVLLECSLVHCKSYPFFNSSFIYLCYIAINIKENKLGCNDK